MGTTGWIVLVIVGVLVLIVLAVVVWLIGAYNNLVRLREAVKTAWSQIDVMLKRRHDLVPNLVETVKGYASHEKETLERVISARNAAATAGGSTGEGGVEKQIRAENQLSGALRQLFAVAEAYPDLKANQNFLQLQNELTNTENGIASQRSSYNTTAQQYNTAIATFPTNLIAGPMGFGPYPYYEVESEAERQTPRVSFA